MNHNRILKILFYIKNDFYILTDLSGEMAHTKVA